MHREFCTEGQKITEYENTDLAAHASGKKFESEECKPAKLARSRAHRSLEKRVSEAARRGRRRKGEGLFLRRIMGKFRDLTSPPLALFPGLLSPPRPNPQILSAFLRGGRLNNAASTISGSDPSFILNFWWIKSGPNAQFRFHYQIAERLREESKILSVLRQNPQIAAWQGS